MTVQTSPGHLTPYFVIYRPGIPGSQPDKYFLHTIEHVLKGNLYVPGSYMFASDLVYADRFEDFNLAHQARLNIQKNYKVKKDLYIQNVTQKVLDDYRSMSPNPGTAAGSSALLESGRGVGLTISENLRCYQCMEIVGYLFDDSRCPRCTRLTVAEVCGL